MQAVSIETEADCVKRAGVMRFEEIAECVGKEIGIRSYLSSVRGTLP